MSDRYEKINLHAADYNGKEFTKKDYIEFIDLILSAWINDDVRSVEECHREFYSYMHPELDVEEEEL